MLGLKQTIKLARTLLLQGMLRNADAAEVERVIGALSTRDTYFSHGSVIDYREALALGLSVRYLAANDPLWERLWLLYCMYEFDARRDDYLKVFEGRSRSTAVSAARLPAAS